MKIIGIDPGLLNTGWGIIEVTPNRQLRYVADGTIKPKATLPMPQRLFVIYEDLKKIIDEYHPTLAGLEDTFVSKFPQSTLKLGQAKGVAMLTPALFNIPVYEFSPTLIKKAITGVGGASKTQIDMMVKTLLNIKGKLESEHASDALAIAIATSFYSKLH
ncbi:MAG: crossover junction endodeoxyribonuclease RuvC [Rickettsiales bacterium]|jgi:crossover junction endodeoxyribonuclease RuvC|nr:crossover junction endodeoxyribonuclease RuvC [Rickettsiales bacterium]